MGKDNQIHSKLITNSARKILRPLGLIQKGKSRTWLDDHGWWLIVVEFQPSSWSRGSYLNVGCCWLWCVKDYESFDEGSRVENFNEFQNETQFAAVADLLAQRAAEEVQRYRQIFCDVNAVANYFLNNPSDVFWRNYHAAIACFLSGNNDHAHQFISKVIQSTDDREWAIAAKADAQELERLSSNTSDFRQVIEERIQQTRTLLKLAPKSVSI